MYEKLIAGKTHGSCLITVDNINVDLFRTFLEIVYVGQCDQQFIVHNELVAFCQEYELPNIEQKLHSAMENLNIDNVTLILQTSIDHNFVDVKARAMNFVRENLSAILKSNRVHKVRPDVFREILQVDDIVDAGFSEISMADAVSRYIEANGDVDKDGYEKAQPFVELIKCIRFPSMKPEDFAHCVQTYSNLLTAEESVKIFVHVMTVANSYSGDFPVRPRNIIVKEPIVETMEMTFVEENKRNNGTIPKIRSIFSVNTAVVITDVFLYDNIGTKCEVSAKIYDPKTHLYASAKGMTNSSNHYSRSYTFDRLLVLNPGQQYFLDIDYERNAQYFYGDPKEKVLSHKNVEIVFDEFNPMLRGFNLNIFERK